MDRKYFISIELSLVKIDLFFSEILISKSSKVTFYIKFAKIQFCLKYKLCIQSIKAHFLILIFKRHINQLIHKLTVFVQSLFMSRLACEAGFLQYPLRGSIG